MSLQRNETIKSRRYIAWHKETVVWTLGLIIVLLLSSPLIVWSASEAGSTPPAVAHQEPSDLFGAERFDTLRHRAGGV